MKIRFAKNDVVDTKALAEMGAAWEGEGDDVLVTLSSEELGWLDSFMAMCHGAVEYGGPIAFGREGEPDTSYSAVTIYNDNR